MPEEFKGPTERLFETLSAFIQANSWNESEEIASQHPELLSDETGDLLSQRFEAAHRRVDHDSAAVIAQHQALLRRCREVGIRQALSELRQEPPDNRTGQLQVVLDALRPDMRSLMVDFNAKSSSPEELSAAVNQHSELAEALARVLQSPLLNPGVSAPNSVQEDLARLQDYESRTDLSLEELLREKELVESILSRISRTDMSVLRAELQGTAGNVCTSLFEATGQRDYAGQAVAAFRQTLTVFQPPSPQWAAAQNNLGNILSRLFEVTEQRDYAGQAVAAYRQALTVRRSPSPQWASTQNNLGNIYRILFGATKQRDYAEEAVAAFRQALTVQRSPSPQWAMTQNNLGVIFSCLLDATGQRDYAEQAVAAYRQALTVRRPPGRDWAATQNNLGNICTSLFKATGQRGYAEQGVAAYRQALTVRRSPRPDWAATQNNLGNTYLSLFDATGQRGYAEQGMEAYRQALTVRRPPSPDWAATQHNLGGICARLFEATRQREYAEQAVDAYRQALTARRPLSPDWAATQNSLGNIYRILFEATGQRDYAEQAVYAYRQALTVLQPPSPDWAATQNNLGTIFHILFEATGQRDYAEQAVAACRQALTVFQPETFPAQCRGSSRMLGRLLLVQQTWPEAAETLAIARQAANHLHALSFGPFERHVGQQQSTGIWSNLGYSLLRLGQHAEAAVVLEEGRARWLMEELQRQEASLQALPLLEKQAFDQAVEAVREAESRFRATDIRVKEINGMVRLLNTALAHGGLPQAEQERLQGELSSPHRQLAQANGRRSAVAEELGRARQEFTALAESLFPDLFGTWDIHQIASGATADAPLVYFTVTPAGAAVLIVPQDGSLDQRHAVFADKLTEASLRQLLAGPPEDHVLGGWLGAYVHRDKDFQRWLAVLEETTAQLWTLLMGDLVRRLSDLGYHRAILIPQGLLGLLPLHAAWREIDGHRRYALDDILFTYALNSRSQVRARQQVEDRSADFLLAVQEPQPVSGKVLPGAQLEVPAISSLFAPVSVLEGSDATREAVRSQLSEAEVLHFACHGGANWDQPLAGGLVMAHDQILSVADVLSLDLSRARLATLSACETAVVGTELPDEALGLPAGFLSAGVPGVVASLWAVGDLSTAMLMERFYRLWKEEQLQPAAALRAAQQWMRDTSPQQKAAYLQRDIPDLVEEQPRMPQEVALSLHEWALLTTHDVSHPYWWAAFTFTGT